MAFVQVSKAKGKLMEAVQRLGIDLPGLTEEEVVLDYQRLG